jgi:chorismate mutase
VGIASRNASFISKMPIIVDPSHICGGRELIPSVSQKALDLDFDGLMIESHAIQTMLGAMRAQQVTPERLGEIFRKFSSSSVVN